MSDIETLTRVLKLEKDYDRLKTLDIPTYSSGTAFPSQPAYGNNRPFYRTDLGWWCFYDGTRWLTCHEYSWTMLYQGGPALDTYSNIRADHAPFFTRIEVHSYVATTNDGTKYWTVTITSNALANAPTTTIYTFNTSGDAVNTHIDHSGTASVQNPANYSKLRILGTKTNTPGDLSLYLNISYRLIVT